MSRVLMLILILASTVALGAEPRFRADDGNLWRTGDNPALAAVSGDSLAFGLAVAPSGGLTGAWDQGTNDLQVLSPLVSFRYTWKDADSTLRFGSALGPFQGVSFGYQTDTVTNRSGVSMAHDFGMLWRPWDALSAGFTVDDAFGPGRLWGAGVALRPLALVGWGTEALTLTADGSWDGVRFAPPQWGARLAWQGSDLRLWYETEAARPGVEVTLALGASELAVSSQRMGQGFRWSNRSPQVPVWGSTILRIREAGVLKPVSGNQAWSLAPAGWTLPGLLRVLDQAARNPAVSAVAFEDPPTTGGLAGAEDLRQALLGLKAAGKKVYIHADTYGDSQGFQAWMASADRISLDPTGSVWLTASGSRRLYLKDFLGKLGVQFVNFAPWETKSANNTLSYSSMPDGERAMLKRFLTDRDALTSQALTGGRGDRLKAPAAEVVAQGPYLVAQQALERGLVDGLETRTDFEAFLKATHPGANLVDDLPVAAERSWGPALAKKPVAVVHLVGDIVGGPGQAGQSIGRDAAEALRSLRDDSGVAAVVLRVDSPGGAVTPSAILADEVKKTVAAGKPVVVVMGDLAASGGYYLSAPASRIIARPGTLTGSIGVTAALLTAPKALDLLGIHADGVEMAPSAGFGDWTRPLTEADAGRWDAMIRATYDRFLDVVAEGRRLDKTKLEPLARGQIYTGREALALGLVDELGGLDEAKSWLEKELKSSIVFEDLVPGRTDPWGGLLGTLATSALKATDSPALRLAGALDQAAAPWAEAVTGVALRGGGPLVWMDRTVVE